MLIIYYAVWSLKKTSFSYGMWHIALFLLKMHIIKIKDITIIEIVTYLHKIIIYFLRNIIINFYFFFITSQ